GSDWRLEECASDSVAGALADKARASRRPVHSGDRRREKNKSERQRGRGLGGGRAPARRDGGTARRAPRRRQGGARAAASDDAVFGDFVAGDGPATEEEVEMSLRNKALVKALAALSERERNVIVLRYGLCGREPKTLEAIGRSLGFTRERVRQIEIAALERLGRLREMESLAAS